MDNPNYYAIIPANVRYSDITPNAKLLYGEITALANKKGYCYASNSYFAELYNVSDVSISNWIKELIEKKFIKRELIYKKGSKEILNRYLRIIEYPPQKNLTTSPKKVKHPPQNNFKDNNTSLILHDNNTSNNINLYQLSVDFWLKELRIGWFFDGTSGKHLNQLLDKLKKIKPDSDDNDIFLAFKYFCLNLPEWFKDKDLPVLNSKFNEIITQIKNNKNGNSKNSKFNNL